MVRVNNQELQYREGMTAVDAIQVAGEYTDRLTLVMVNGKIRYREQLYSEKLMDGADIKLMRIISGG